MSSTGSSAAGDRRTFVFSGLLAGPLSALCLIAFIAMKSKSARCIAFEEIAPLHPVMRGKGF